MKPSLRKRYDDLYFEYDRIFHAYDMTPTKSQMRRLKVSLWCNALFRKDIKSIIEGLKVLSTVNITPQNVDLAWESVLKSSTGVTLLTRGIFYTLCVTVVCIYFEIWFARHSIYSHLWLVPTIVVYLWFCLSLRWSLNKVNHHYADNAAVGLLHLVI